ncbi:GSK3-beta interaction protein-like [Mytilus californianus]|uniref:GSK3-beta interaction protein-like n=1 Tax=Mytilus californianus TaxID=6549 RepID=UPI0022478FD4|nr:GSK3-beta interaction protein-like [Mytilus californianus]
MDHDEHTLRIEAEEVVKEVSYAVKFVIISPNLPSNNQLVYLNLETKENEEFCVELSVRGFRVVSRHFDKIDNLESRCYETIYALLDNLSPGYRNTFGDTLAMKLYSIQQGQSEDASF